MTSHYWEFRKKTVLFLFTFRTESFTTEDEPIPTGSTTLMNAFNTTTNISNTLTTPVEQGSADVGAIIGSVMSVVIVLVIVLAVVFWRRRKRYSRVPRMLN